MRLLLALVLVIPLGLDLYMPVPEENPLTAERVRVRPQSWRTARCKQRSNWGSI